MTVTVMYSVWRTCRVFAGWATALKLQDSEEPGRGTEGNNIFQQFEACRIRHDADITST